jgi:hypothetical protein
MCSWIYGMELVSFSQTKTTDTAVQTLLRAGDNVRQLNNFRINFTSTVQPRLMQGQSTKFDHVTRLHKRSKPTSRSCLA